MTRAVLGGLVGHSAEWVKAVETGRLQVPRLPMLLRIARALDVRDLAELTGDGHAVPVQAFAGEAHAALTDYRFPACEAPVNDADKIPSLARRSRHLIEVARAYHQRHDGASTYAMLHAAERTAPETIRFNGYARDILLSLAATPPAGQRDEVPALCRQAGIQL